MANYNVDMPLLSIQSYWCSTSSIYTNKKNDFVSPLMHFVILKHIKPKLSKAVGRGHLRFKSKFLK